jgi:hypothetical protein
MRDQLILLKEDFSAVFARTGPIKNMRKKFWELSIPVAEKMLIIVSFEGERSATNRALVGLSICMNTFVSGQVSSF